MLNVPYIQIIETTFENTITTENTDMIELNQVISVYQCPQWFNKILAVVFNRSLFDCMGINVIYKTMH